MRIWTIPNLMTFSRLLLLYPILYYLHAGHPLPAFIFMVLGVITDLLDGTVARKFNQQSDLGRIMDPVIDKIDVLTVTAYMVFSSAYHYPVWFFVFLLTRELAVLIGGATIARNQKMVMEATRPGKLSAFFTGITVPVYIFNFQPWGLWVVFLALGLNLYSSWVYFQRFKKQLKQSRIHQHAKAEGDLR